MARDYLRVSFFVQALEEANGKMLCEIVSMARLANISLGIMAKTASHQDLDIDLYFHTRRTIDHLQREANRQKQLLDALKKELIHARDGDTDAVPPCVLFDYENAEAC
jgi:hypothetical protein